jgi:hypothetical protein
VLNEIIFQNKEKFLKLLFNRSIGIGEIKIAATFTDGYVLKYYNDESASESDVAQKPTFRLDVLVDGRVTLAIRFRNIDLPDLCNFIISSVAKELIPGKYGASFRTLFLPASRTGFMLTYKSLIGKSISTAFSEAPHNEEEYAKTTLTRACTDFLQHLGSISSEENKKKKNTNEYCDVIKFLKTDILDGEIHSSNDPIPDFLYKPSSSEQYLPLFVSSGVVTEIAPLLLLLKDRTWETIMIEEPEMCLHPYLQQQMARALIKIMNAGTNIIATTHSDTIVQHVNNMIKLSAHPDREALCEKFGYSETDLLPCDKVRIYQFDVDSKSQKTHVEALKCEEYGFEVPTFYNALLKMFDESSEFENEVE